MYELMIKGDFAAAHNLRNYKGKCEHIHGHNYIVEVYLEKEKLGKDGLVIDFAIIKKKLNKILDKLDHKYLNKDVDFFKKNNPSAENIARYIFLSLKKVLKGIKVKKVNIWESENSMAGYYE